MNRKTTAIALCLLLLGISVMAQINSNPSKTQISKTMNTTLESTQPLRAFFNAFGKGDFEGIVETFHPEATITAVRDGRREDNDLYGTYKGKEGARVFISNLGAKFDTKSFDVESIIGEGDIAFANGTFSHQLKSTSKLFESAWALRIVVKEGKIYEYHFYEDSEKFAEASN